GPRHFLAAPLFHRVEPGPQGPGPTDGRRRRQDQDPAQQAIAFLGDVAGADPPRTPTPPRRQADVAGDAGGARETLDVAELEHEDNRDEGANAGDRREALHTGILAPAGDELGIQAPDLGVQTRQPRRAILSDPARPRRQGQLLQLPLTALREPTLSRPRLQVAPG